MLVQYAVDGDSASIAEVLLFPESEDEMDSRFCLLIKLERLKGGWSDIVDVYFSKDEEQCNRCWYTSRV